LWTLIRNHDICSPRVADRAVRVRQPAIVTTPWRSSARRPEPFGPKAAALCIAQKWITNTRRTTAIRHVYANDTAFDVFVPGEQPPYGSAALVRPAPSGTGSAVSFRGSAPDVTGAIGQGA
jgi:hypothetical protein